MRMEDFTPASDQKVPWRCGTLLVRPSILASHSPPPVPHLYGTFPCGWKWAATIKDRTRSNRLNVSGCPACAGMVATETNNLALTCAQSEGRLAHLPVEWNHPTMRMEERTTSSQAKVPWKCRKCGGKWDAKISSRTRRVQRTDRPSGCPACAGWVATETNNLALACAQSEGRLAHLPGEWIHPTKRMEDFTTSSHAKVPWRCGTCEWEWGATMNARTRSDRPSGCPACNPVGGSKPKKLIEP
jgi:hypothetical protein